MIFVFLYGYSRHAIMHFDDRNHLFDAKYMHHVNSMKVSRIESGIS